MRRKKLKYWEGDKLVGLDLIHWDSPEDEVSHSLDVIALSCLDALKIAVLAIEQSVTGEKLLDSLDVRKFYQLIDDAVTEWSGVGIEGEHVNAVIDEIDSLTNLFKRAQQCTAK